MRIFSVLARGFAPLTSPAPAYPDQVDGRRLASQPLQPGPHRAPARLTLRVAAGRPGQYQCGDRESQPTRRRAVRSVAPLM